jgi:hypothetical protein
MGLAPIVLFVYNRLAHTQHVIESLQQNTLAKESELYIYSDAPRNDGNRKSVEKVREYIRDIDGFRSVSIVERKENYGVDKSIIVGATEIVNRFGKIIVLEDDLESHPQFLEYMNSALEKYRNSKRVFSITGYSYTTDIEDENIEETFFLKLTNSWSWATWVDRWELLDKHTTGWEECKHDSKLISQFNYDNSYPYAKIMESQLKQRKNTWDILWYWTVFRRDGLTLYPRRSLVRNIGFDGSGVHCSNIGNDKLLGGSYNFSMSNDVIEKAEIRQIAAAVLRAKYNLRWHDKVRFWIIKCIDRARMVEC